MSHDPHHIIEVLPVHLRLALPEEAQGGGTRSNWANQRLLRTCLMALRSLTMDMTSFLQGIAPRATNQLLQSSSPRGSPRAHGWTERPRRSTPSAIECQDVRVWPPDLDEGASHHEAVMAGATEMDGRDEEKFLVFLRFILTPSGPAPYCEHLRPRSVTDLPNFCRRQFRAGSSTVRSNYVQTVARINTGINT